MVKTLQKDTKILQKIFRLKCIHFRRLTQPPKKLFIASLEKFFNFYYMGAKYEHQRLLWFYRIMV